MTALAIGAATNEGALTIRFANVEVMLRASGALWLAQEQMLVVADLHLEKGSAYAARGQLLPPYDTRETLDRLEREIVALAPRSVVLLGDTLHDGDAGVRIGEVERARIADLATRTQLIWVCGNHDPDGAGDLGGETAVLVQIAGLTLRHDPSPYPVVGEVAGHLHPCARLQGSAGGVRRRCFASDGRRLILPAFGAYAGGLNVRDAAFADLFNRPPISFALGRSVVPIAYERLRPDRPLR
ncbi:MULTISPECIES: ligase-associated DNA damage response endonuclease PdeM [unclassified Brevundimonas]|uniref:ligase-associated DNA damage response endonuclease PdeM n=1 Tax=unclassified Brevundimonas TaxID=2622653 RepID=UPI0025BD79F5|nr:MULTISPECIES: ligase-associated DNA damage response endonuclease PdeM [unclassified Brevundimonas]